ncbi:MAG TPA: UPF0147 family protein [Candidatus Nanoarchaeia archaeon]|nr:UPF0147 family protein [Candidatus Nanoarchaeia archaeon]
MAEKEIEEIVLVLKTIKDDTTIPKNIKEKLDQAIATLCKGTYEQNIRIDKALEELDSISDDPNTPTYTRLEVLNIISTLGSKL